MNNYIITAEHTIKSAGNPDINYYFATGTYVTKSTDTLANTVFRGDITSKISLDKEIGFFAWGTQSKTTISSIKLINRPDRKGLPGFYDDIPSQSVRDSKIVLKIVKQNASYDTAIKIGGFIVDNYTYPSDDFIVYDLLDKISLLDKNTQHLQFSDSIQFANNRGLDQPIPIGYVYQADIPLIDKNNGYYQVSTAYGNVTDVINLISNNTLKERADPFVYGTDYTYLLTIPNTGGLGWDLTNATNNGTITCDYLSLRYNASIQSNTFQGFVGRLLVDATGYPATDIDFTSAAQIDTDFGYGYGYYIKTAENAKAILTKCCSSHCGFFYQSNQGQIVFDVLKPPQATATFEVNSLNLASGVSITLDTAPGLSDSAAARKNVYKFSYDEVRDIGGLSEEDKQTASSEYQYYCRSTVTTAGNDVFHDTYAHARNGCYKPTLLTEKTDAQDFIVQCENLYSVERNHYDMSYIADNLLELLQLELNTTFKLTHDRYSLNSGKNLILTRMKIPNLLANKAQIRGWG